MKLIIKPWGKEEILEMNGNYMVKKLTMWKGHCCSLQYHNKKRETIYVIAGNLKISLGEKERDLQDKMYGPNESVTIEPKMVHRMEAMEDSIYLEASTPEIDDVVRISDDYQR